MKRNNMIKRLLLISACLFFTACQFNKPVPTQYYLLSADKSLSEIADLNKIIGVNLVVIPDHLDRANLAIYESNQQITYSNNNRWAESLSDNLQQVIQLDVQALLPQSRVMTYPWISQQAPDYQIKVIVSQFGYVASNSVDLQAQWQIVDQSRELISQRSFAQSMPLQDRDFAQIIGMKNQLLAQLSQQIVEDINSLSQ